MGASDYVSQGFFILCSGMILGVIIIWIDYKIKEMKDKNKDKNEES
jgi:hypothetical protein